MTAASVQKGATRMEKKQASGILQASTGASALHTPAMEGSGKIDRGAINAVAKSSVVLQM